MRLSDIGEKEFIRRLLPQLGCPSTLANSLGDDAAILKVDLPAGLLAFKIDRVPKPYAYARGLASSSIWGRLCVVSNFSDIFAVGGTPIALMISVTMPRSSPVEEAEELILGARAMADELGGALVGGDTKEGPQIEVVGAAVGTLRDSKGWSRKTAQIGNVVAVAREVGAFIAAVASIELLSEVEEIRRDALRILSEPIPCIREAEVLRGLPEAVTFATDLSDGLGEGLRELCLNAPGSVTIDSQSLPVSAFARHVASKLRLPVSRFAFGAGDWGLLVCIRPEFWDQLRALFSVSNLQISAIGIIEEGQGLFCDNMPVLLPIHDHFRLSFEDTRAYLQHVLYQEPPWVIVE